MSSGVPAATISPPPSPPSGPEVDDPVRRLDHFEIVLDDDDGVAALHQLVQHFQKLRHVVEMQPRGGLVQDIERAAGGALG